MRWTVVWMLACSPGSPEGSAPAEDPSLTATDADADGYYAAGPYGNDCDDADPAVHPDADDLTCDGIDNDCYRGDGPDADGDLVTACQADCDDTDPARAPGVPERCDGEDNDCDLAVDEDFDQDGDGVLDCRPGFWPGRLEVGARSPAHPECINIALLDIDHDGVDEVVCAGTPSLQSMWLLRTVDDCVLCGIRTLDGEAVMAVRAGGDINGDGFEDVVAVLRESPVGPALRIHFGQAGPALATPTDPWGELQVLAVAGLGDVTDDGFDDLAVLDLLGVATLAEGSATGVDAQGILGSFRGVTAAVALEATDVTGDARVDLLVSLTPDFSPAPLWSLPSGTFIPLAAGDPALGSFGDPFVELATGGDLDGDGLGDVVYLQPEFSTLGLSSSFAVARGASDGALLGTSWRVPAGDMARAAAIAPDLNGDGLSDAITLRSMGDELMVQAWTGWPSPRPFAEALLPASRRDDPRDADLAMGDVDGDGVTDIVVSTGVSVWVLRTGGDCDDHDASVISACQ